MPAIAMSLAAPGMNVVSFDFCGDARVIARENIEEKGLLGRHLHGRLI